VKTVAITAGRNVRSVPLGDSQWQDLRHQIGATLADAGATIYTRDAIGSGQWESPSGELIREESVTYVGAIQDAVLDALSRNISRIAADFHQDAIALIVGESLLIEGESK
jgi:hypothetical protein